MTSAHLKQRQESQGEQERFAALALKPEHVLWREEAIKNGLGLLRGFLGDRAARGSFAFVEQGEVQPITCGAGEGLGG